MTQARNAGHFKPLVPKAHNSLNILLTLQIKSVLKLIGGFLIGLQAERTFKKPALLCPASKKEIASLPELGT